MNSRYVTALCLAFLVWAIMATSLLCNQPIQPYATLSDTITVTDTFIRYVHIYEKSPDTIYSQTVAATGSDSTLHTVASWSLPIGRIVVGSFGRCAPDSFQLSADFGIPEYHSRTTITQEQRSVELTCMAGPGIAAAGIMAPLRRARIGVAYNFLNKSLLGQINIPLFTKRPRPRAGL